MIATSIPRGVSAQPAISSEIAPLGKLRVAMNAQTPVLLQRTPDGKITGGVALEVGKFIAEKLGVPFEGPVRQCGRISAELRQGRMGYWLWGKKLRWWQRSGLH